MSPDLSLRGNSVHDLASGEEVEEIDELELKPTDLATTWKARKQPAAATPRIVPLSPQQAKENKAGHDEGTDPLQNDSTGGQGLGSTFLRQRVSPKPSGQNITFYASSNGLITRQSVNEPKPAGSKDYTQATIDDEDPPDARGATSRTLPGQQAESTKHSEACTRCRAKKVKCNRQKPCDTCRRIPGAECLYIGVSFEPPMGIHPSVISDIDSVRQSRAASRSPSDASPEPTTSDHLQALKDMGFDEYSILAALRATREDFDQALDLLLGTSNPEDFLEMSPSRQLAVQGSSNVPIFPGMSEPYQLPDSATTCLIEGCPRMGQEPEKTAGSLRARLHEHMKRRHGWPRDRIRKPDSRPGPGSAEKSKPSGQTALSSPTRRPPKTPTMAPPSRELLASDGEFEMAGVHSRSCSKCHITSSPRWHPKRPQQGETTLCHRCYMSLYRNKTKSGKANFDPSRSPDLSELGDVAETDMKKKCANCSATGTSQWHPPRANNGMRLLCQRCYMFEYRHGKHRPVGLTRSKREQGANEAGNATEKRVPLSAKSYVTSCANCSRKLTADLGNNDEALCETCIEHARRIGLPSPSCSRRDESRSKRSVGSAQFEATGSNKSSDESDGPVVFKRRKTHHSVVETPDPRIETPPPQIDGAMDQLNRPQLNTIRQTVEPSSEIPEDTNPLLAKPSLVANNVPASKLANDDDVQQQSSFMSSSTAPSHARLDSVGPRKLALKYGNETTVRLVALLYSLPLFKEGAFMKGSQFAYEEDRLIKHLKEDLRLRWEKIQEFLPHRPSWMTLQAHYSQKINQSPRRGRAIDTETWDVGTDQEEGIPMMNNFMDTGRRRSRRAVANVAPGAYVVPPPLDSQSFELQQQTPVIDSVSEDGRPTSRTTNDGVERSNSTNITRRPSEVVLCGSQASEVVEALHQRDLVALTSGVSKLTRLNRRSTQVPRPYLNRRERSFLQQDPTLWDSSTPETWRGAILHVDFAGEELQRVLLCATKVFRREIDRPDLTLRQLIALQIRGASRNQLAQVADKVIRSSAFINRSHESVEQFLVDIAVSRTERQRKVTETSYLTMQRANRSNLCHHLRHRELGNATVENMRDALDTLGPRLYFKGTSSDVNVVRWAPDGSRFVVGSAALTDESSMQYNRSNNLLFGDIRDGTIQELAQHVTKRSATNGVNSRHEMMATQDPFLFHTISAAEFTPDGRRMISTGYDNTAVVWDLSDKIPRPVIVSPHSSAIDVLAVNSSGLFATGIKSVLEKKKYPAVRILHYDINQGNSDWETARAQIKLRKYYSQRGADVVEPSCLNFGRRFGGQDKYLLAGFCSRVGDYGSGEVTLWDVTRDDAPLINSMTTNVFDAIWSPTNFGVYAVGYSASHNKNVNRGTRSIIRLFDSFRTPDSDVVFRKTRMCELECPALDINDLLFCDKDANLISAGCTNGSVYTWDLRMPDSILHTFEHAPTLSVHDHRDDPERVDTGVRFLSWGQGSRHIYSGSSDGVVAAWDPYRSAEDAYLHDVVRLDSGVMSGAFSPDFTDLIIGDIHGSVSLLSVGSDRSPDLDTSKASTFEFQEAVETKEKLRRKYGNAAANTPVNTRLEGAAAAKELIRSGQVELRPLGNLPIRQAVQGPRYNLPKHNGRDEIVTLRIAAEAFQATLRLHETEPRCACTGNGPLLTEEELGDSGAWKERIPATMRFRNSPSDIRDGSIRPASVSSVLKSDKLDVRCFRCNNSYLVRSTTSRVSSQHGDVFRCSICRAKWCVDVLGYTLVRHPHTGKRSTASKPSAFADVDVTITDGQFTPEAEVEDISLDMRKYYQSMWN